MLSKKVFALRSFLSLRAGKGIPLHGFAHKSRALVRSSLLHAICFARAFASYAFPVLPRPHKGRCFAIPTRVSNGTATQATAPRMVVRQQSFCTWRWRSTPRPDRTKADASRSRCPCCQRLPVGAV